MWRWAGAAQRGRTESMEREIVVDQASWLVVDEREERKEEIYCPRRHKRTGGRRDTQNIRDVDDPARVIERQSAGGNYAMDMRVESKFLIPGMENAEEADLSAEVF